MLLRRRPAAAGRSCRRAASPSARPRPRRPGQDRPRRRRKDPSPTASRPPRRPAFGRGAAQQRCIVEAVLLVQPVGEGVGEQHGVTGGDRRAEQRGCAALAAPSACATSPEARSATAPCSSARRDASTGASGRLGASRRPADARRPARSRTRRRTAPPRGCRRDLRALAELEQLAGRQVRPATAAPATRPSAIAAALEPSPRSSGILFRKRKLWPSMGASSAKARSVRWPALRASSFSPSPSISTSRRPGLLDTASFQRSSAAAAASKPGPRLAVDAGARTRSVMRAPPGSRRSSRRPARQPSGRRHRRP